MLNNCFKGWYFKIEAAGEIFCFIVGVSTAKDDRHAFIQYVDCEHTHYFRFGYNEFFADKKDLKIRVGANVFSAKGIKCELGNAQLRANLKFDDFKMFKGNVMGPFAILPMVCKHGVVSMNFNVSGTIEEGGKNKKIKGLGYIENDSGCNFPKNYFWAQGQNKKVSVMFALAWPLVFGIKGFLCVVDIGCRQYNLSLYTGAKLRVKQMADELTELSLKKGKTELTLHISGKKSNFKELAAPLKEGNMQRIIKENVCGKIKGKFVTKKETAEFELPAAYEIMI